jgi:hypothetical protein
LPGLIEPGQLRSFARTSAHKEHVVLYKGVPYSVVATAEPDIWEWRYELDDTVKTGRTQTRLPALAARRVRWKIDAALRSRNPAPAAPDVSEKPRILTR